MSLIKNLKTALDQYIASNSYITHIIDPTNSLLNSDIIPLSKDLSKAITIILSSNGPEVPEFLRKNLSYLIRFKKLVIPLLLKRLLTFDAEIYELYNKFVFLLRPNDIFLLVLGNYGVNKRTAKKTLDEAVKLYGIKDLIDLDERCLKLFDEKYVVDELVKIIKLEKEKENGNIEKYVNLLLSLKKSFEVFKADDVCLDFMSIPVLFITYKESILKHTTSKVLNQLNGATDRPSLDLLACLTDDTDKLFVIRSVLTQLCTFTEPVKCMKKYTNDEIYSNLYFYFFKLFKTTQEIKYERICKQLYNNTNFHIGSENIDIVVDNELWNILRKSKSCEHYELLLTKMRKLKMRQTDVEKEIYCRILKSSSVNSTVDLILKDLQSKECQDVAHAVFLLKKYITENKVDECFIDRVSSLLMIIVRNLNEDSEFKEMVVSQVESLLAVLLDKWGDVLQKNKEVVDFISSNVNTK